MLRVRKMHLSWILILHKPMLLFIALFCFSIVILFVSFHYLTLYFVDTFFFFWRRISDLIWILSCLVGIQGVNEKIRIFFELSLRVESKFAILTEYIGYTKIFYFISHRKKIVPYFTYTSITRIFLCAWNSFNFLQLSFFFFFLLLLAV